MAMFLAHGKRMNIVQINTYRRKRHHRVAYDGVNWHYKCDVFYPRPTLDIHAKIVSEGDDIMEISESTLCHNCFGRNNPKIKVNANSGRIK
jgi:hypothetical protein